MGAYDSWWTKVSTFKGATRELTLDRIAHVPKPGRHNLLSAKRLITAFDAPMRVYPATASIRPRFGRKTLVFRSFPESGLFEIKAHRRADMKEPQTPLITARSMVTARANPRHIMELHRLLSHPSEEITRGTACISGVPLTGTWSSCVQCSESRVFTPCQNRPKAALMSPWSDFLSTSQAHFM